jgi:hypothetical protein
MKMGRGDLGSNSQLSFPPSQAFLVRSLSAERGGWESEVCVGQEKLDSKKDVG